MAPAIAPPPTDPPDVADEAEWLEAAQRGERDSFARIVERYWDRLYRWLYQMTRDRHRAEDLTQETFLKALAGIGSFRLGSNFRAWLFRIGHNNFVNMKRAERKTTQALPEEIEEKTTGGPGTAAGDREILEQVAHAVADLPPDFRSALLLRCEQGLSFKEVAAVLGTTEETARWRVFKARQKLLKVLPEDILPAKADEG